MISDAVGDGVDSALRAVEDTDLRAAIVETFETARRRAAAGEIDVVVLAARRLACVYQLLLDVGLPPLNDVCDVVSDRYLDLPGDWSGRSVLIIDDSVVVGTTLLRLHDRISARVGERGVVASMAACLDEQQYARYLVDAVGLTAMRSRPSRRSPGNSWRPSSRAEYRSSATTRQRPRSDSARRCGTSTYTTTAGRSPM